MKVGSLLGRLEGDMMDETRWSVMASKGRRGVLPLRSQECRTMDAMKFLSRMQISIALFFISAESFTLLPQILQPGSMNSY